MRVSIALVASFIALQSLQYGGGKAWAEVGGADTIYSGGDILTMAGDSPQYVEALATEGGKIIFAGALSAALTLKSDETAMVDLKGATLLPGFIDAHGQFIH
jgi:predicted amidohydrolase YtcJ